MRGSQEAAQTIRAAIAELGPAIAASLRPPEGDDTAWETLGATPEKISDFTLGGLRRRLDVIGAPL